MKTLDDLIQEKNRIIIIHYASTSFFEQPVEVTQVAVRDYATGQTQSFGHETYSTEKEILEALGDFMKSHPGRIVIGWNTHGKTYGVQALSDRWKANSVQGEFPIEVDQVVDLDDVLANRFGWAYAVGPNKLRRLAEANGAYLQGFVDGKDEIELYKQRRYQDLLLSTERKVAVIAYLLSKAFSGDLVVLSLVTHPPSSAISLRVVLTISAISQVYVFVGVVLVSLLIGSVDFTLPVKTAFLSTIFILIGFAIGDFVRDWNGRAGNPSQLGISTYRLIGEVGTSLSLLALAYGFLVQQLVVGNLVGRSAEVKFVTVMGLMTLVGFTVLVVSDMRPLLKRRKSAPFVSVR